MKYNIHIKLKGYESLLILYLFKNYRPLNFA